MITKKCRPFWSYDVERTERWLAKMAEDGKRLTRVSLLTRMFKFEEGPAEKVQFQVVYDKNRNKLPYVLEHSGWDVTAAEQKWTFIKNNSTEIKVYPSREGILKRNRLHFYVSAGLSLFFIMPLLMMSIIFFMIIASITTVEPSPFWIITVGFFLQILFVMGLTIFLFKKLKTFETKYFGGEVEVCNTTGKTFGKWKLAWMYAPDLLENWLSEMAAEGNHLIRVGKPAVRFIFEKGEPRRVSYVLDYQLRTSPFYIEVHKGAGWQLKYTSPYSFAKYSIWAQEYGEGEVQPLLTYDASERRAQIRKVIVTGLGYFVYSTAILGFALWTNYSIRQSMGWTTINVILVALLMISFIPGISILIKTLRYVMRMRSA